MSTAAAEYLAHCRAALQAEQAQSLAATGHWAHVDRAKVHADWDALYKALVPLIGQHTPDAPEVQALLAGHFEIASRFYMPSKEAYIGMSLFYAEDAAMRAFHDAYHPDLVAFMGQAMPLYAQRL